LRLDTSYAHRSLLELPTNGGEVGVAIGAQSSSHRAVWVGARGFWGHTVDGLEVGSGTLTLDGEAVFGRLRVGGAGGVLLIGFGRATRSETITSWGLNADLALRVDLLRSGGTALFARAQLDGGFELHGSAYWGPSVGLGVAFDLGGNRTAIER
jgi:hypothetical protein